uniref:Saposin B-type domain-containing protein n=1 Tax=Panagrellus redivivus TaxID=6233 RepID=A0A7E4UYC3_PANRE
MNTATVLVIAALALVALAEQDWCQVCQDAVGDARAEVGNDGKGASEQAIMAAFMNVCNNRLASSVYHDKCIGMRDYVAQYLDLVKLVLDNGASNHEMCLYGGACKSNLQLKN